MHLARCLERYIYLQLQQDNTSLLPSILLSAIVVGLTCRSPRQAARVCAGRLKAQDTQLAAFSEVASHSYTACNIFSSSGR